MEPKLFYRIWPTDSLSPATIVALHGFLGDGLDFQPLIALTKAHFRWVTIDLLGHGASDSPRELEFYDLNHQSSQLQTCIRELQLGRFTLLGYSMGGRLALQYAIRNPDFLEHLVLIGTSAGIACESARVERKKQDAAWANLIQEQGVAEFLSAWNQQPLIATQQKYLSPSLYQELQKRRRQNNWAGIINSLLGFGVGVMPSCSEQLGSLELPVTMFTGVEDKKFRAIAKEMLGKIKSARHIEIPDAGHAPHLENPSSLYSALTAGRCI